METGEKIIEVSARSKGEVKNRRLELGKNIRFDTDILETFALRNWESIVYDAMVVAAAVECADRGFRRPVGRPSYGWARELCVTIPVCNIDLWRSPDVIKGFREAIEFLTGDRWHISFKKLEEPETPRGNLFLNMEVLFDAVTAFSEGMDSHAVAGIIDPEEKLARVRMKPRKPARGNKEACVAVPYSIKTGRAEDSARSRGFKFAMIGAVAAYLTNAEKIIVPESGQEAVGVALLSVGHKYPDYRTSPLFARRMEIFLEALFKRPFRFEFPRIWHTKGETLRVFVDSAEEFRKDSWKKTRSCWRTNQWVSVEGKRRQCGVCAACMLRRVSVHAAGLKEEEPDAYVCNNMEGSTLEAAADPKFPESKLNKAFREYAIAGVLHMDHLSALADKRASGPAKRHAMFLGPALGIPREEAEKRINGLLARHAAEWKEYVKSLGPDSFVGKLARMVK